MCVITEWGGYWQYSIIVAYLFLSDIIIITPMQRFILTSWHRTVLMGKLQHQSIVFPRQNKLNKVVAAEHNTVFYNMFSCLYFSLYLNQNECMAVYKWHEVINS